MGQQLFKVNFDIVDPITPDDSTFNFSPLVSDNDLDDIRFFSSKASAEMMTGPIETGTFSPNANYQTLFIKKIQNHLSILTNSSEFTNLNTQINAILTEKVFPLVSNNYEKAMKEVTIILENQQKLHTFLMKKLKADENLNGSIFTQPFIYISSNEAKTDTNDDEALKIAKQKQQKAEFKAQQVSYFALQSLTSMLLILIRSVEKNDPLLVHQILSLANQLCDQIPMKYLSSIESSSNFSNFLSKSLKPLTEYIHELSLSKNSIIANQAKKILLSFAIAQGSLRDILPILCRLIFETNEIYDVRGLFIQMNDSLTETIDEWEKEKKQITTEEKLDSNSDTTSENTEAIDEQEKEKQQITTEEKLDSNSNQEQDQNDDTTPKKTADETSSIPLDYLKSNETFPSIQMMKLDEKIFTGQFISSIILAHLDFDNEINITKQFEYDSISFDFHPNTFKQLFYLIEQLTTRIQTENSNPIIIYNLTVCLKLFTTHLKYLSVAKSHINRDLLSKNKEMETIFQTLSSQLNDNIILTTFPTKDELKTWFDLCLELSDNNDHTSLCQIASKALIYIIDQQTSSFTEKLSIIHHYIIENKHPIFIEQLFIELNKTVTLFSWIEILCDQDDNNNNQEKLTALNILNSFIDIYFNSTITIKEEYKNQIEKFLLLFQQLLLYRLAPNSKLKKIYNIKSNDKTTTEETESSPSDSTIPNPDISPSPDSPIINPDISTSSFITKYITHILNHYINKPTIINKLFNPIITGLCLMTKIDDIFNFPIVQPIFADILPLLAEYILKIENNNNNLHLIIWMLGKMNNIMITSLQKDSLEIKHADKLKLPIFTSGCETTTIENNPYLLNLFKSNLSNYSQFKFINQTKELSSDKEFLMSIYNNIDQGAKLISKMKIYIKDKQRLLKSIEQQANNACAAVFAVYIKHFRRINLAKNELLQITDNKKPHSKLLTIYSYATNVQTLFATTKAQGGDCNELYEEIKINSLFLLLNVKESHFIPIIEEDLSQRITTTTINTLSIPNDESNIKIQYQRQRSRWTKAKQIIKLLQNTMKACIRFKTLMLAKKQAIEQKRDNESILNQTINDYIYGDYYKLTTSITSEEKKLEAQQIEKTMSKQYERAMTRFISYRFAQTFIQNLLNIKDENRIQTILNIYLPHMRNPNLDWSYLENISATDNKLKKDIRNTYYSIINISTSYLFQSKIFQTKIFEQNIFYLLNLSYESADHYYLQHYQLIDTLFTSFVCFINKSNRTILLKTKLIAFNWFRLLVLKLCENIENEELKGLNNQILQQQREFIFNKFILNEFKQLKQTLTKNDTIDKIDSFKNTSIEWFIKASTSSSSQIEIDLYTNQLLILLLRCLHLYEHVRSTCANIEYIEELLHIYRNSQHSTTLLLTLKILRKLIPVLPNNINNKSNIIIQNFLNESLNLIGDSFTSQQITRDIVTELIYIYRTVMSINSSWQIIAIQFIFNTIKTYLNMKSIENLNKNYENNLLASLCVLGGYIQPFGLGSIVKIYTDEGTSDEFQLAMIIEIDTKDSDVDSTNTSSFLIQYLQTNQIESVSIDKLRLEIDISPPNLLLLPNPTDPNITIHSLLDVLGSFIEIDTSITSSLILLQLKRRSISALYHILNNKKLVEIFMQKPYASVIARLSISNSLSCNRIRPSDLHLFDKQHLEQYCLSLDNCERLKQIIENSNKDINDNKTFTNDEQIIPNQLISTTLSTNIFKYNGWKPYASKEEIEIFRHGRIGNDDISIISVPDDVVDRDAIEECGNNHKFLGRIKLNDKNCSVPCPKFIIENLQLTQGKWYYCIKVTVSSTIRIGWATTGYIADGGTEMGYDSCSWCYDGTSGYLYHNGSFDYSFTELRWKDNDICGCGIEINGENTQIKYWLNGQFIGTAFTQRSDTGSDKSHCDMFPNGKSTTFFPCIYISASNSETNSYEFIFHPDDMNQCPLPYGYKPLLLPKLINIENSIVPYPYSAYLIDNDIQNNIYTNRTKINSNIYLRDFVNEHHIETTFSLNEHYLVLPETSNGFLFSIDNDGLSSFTISFDFTIENNTDDKLEIPLFTSDITKKFLIQLPSNKIDGKIHTAIIVHLDEQQIKIYMNNECRIITNEFLNEIKTKINLNILPNISTRIENIAIWKYALSEEHIRRLFTYNLTYIANDYQQLKDYRNHVNTISFKNDQKQFENDLLIPFNQPFKINDWEKKKKQIDENESKYFKTIDTINKSTLQLYGNKTYLILNKSKDTWYESIIILDILIPNFPSDNQRLSLIKLNPKVDIYITHDGHICIVQDDTNTQSESTLILNEYIRLVISIHKGIKIYMNGILHLEVNSTDEQCQIKSNRIELFKENNLLLNKTNDDIVRIECQSITFLTHSLLINQISEQIKSSNLSLDILIIPPLWLIVSSLIAIGYKKTWIKSVIEQYKTTNIQFIDTILREQKDKFIQEDFENNQKRYLEILISSSPSIDHEKLKDLIDLSKINTDKQITNISEIMLIHWNELQTLKIETKENTDSSQHKWFHESAHRLGIHETMGEWIQDKSGIIELDPTQRLLNLNKPEQDLTITDTIKGNQQKKIQKSIQYSHKQISYKQYFESRIACEHGLMTIYARYTILNMLRVWSNDGSNLFPWEKFGNCAFIVTLLRLMDYHYTYTRIHTDETIDRMSMLTSSILKVEVEELLKYITTHGQINDEIQQTKAPLLYHLLKDIISQLIQFLLDPSLLKYNCDDEINIDEQTLIKQPNWNFLYKIISLFVSLIKDKSILKQDQIDSIIPILFPTLLINLIFNLFMIVPTHQMKISILQLFSTLIQTSENFNLNEQIQHFLCELFIELSTNMKGMKKLQVAVQDLVFLLISRQKKHPKTEIKDEEQKQGIESYIDKFPENIRNLFIVIDVINVLTEKIKHTQLPETFFAQSAEILSSQYSLTDEEHDQSNIHFDATSDRQLILFMNKHPSISDTFSNFIITLPTESEPNSTYYKVYPALTNIAADCIQTRAKLFYQFNKFIGKVLSLVDLNSLPGQSIITDKIRIAKLYLLYDTKFQMLNESLDRTGGSYSYETIEVKFDTVKASDGNDKIENTMFYQAFQQLYKKAHIIFRRPSDQLWQAIYLGMYSSDAGGPYRDSITRICMDICSTRLPLFILCPNGRMNRGLNRDCWIPNIFPPKTPIPNKIKKQYRFVGQLMGMAIRRKHYLDLKFPILLWKQLVRDQITIDDIEAIDMENFTIISEMEKKLEQTKSNDTDDDDINYLLSSVMNELRFEVISSAGQIYELIPGGKDIPITAANLKQYCTMYREYRLNEFRRQIEFIRQGLYSIVPYYYLSLFTAGELEEAVCGKGEIDVEILKRNTYYESTRLENSPNIQRFWTVFGEMFNDEQRKAFLVFVWGRNTLPTRDADFSRKFCINSLYVEEGQADKALPRSHTCFFTLDLPEYSTAEIMYERINYAITYCLSVDGDGGMNEAPDTTDFAIDPTLDE